MDQPGPVATRCEGPVAAVMCRTDRRIDASKLCRDPGEGKVGHIWSIDAKERNGYCNSNVAPDSRESLAEVSFALIDNRFGFDSMRLGKLDTVDPGRRREHEPSGSRQSA